MASEKNLNAVFTDIANAIREKKGTTEQFQPINMAEEIANLPSGGGNTLKALLDERKNCQYLFYGYKGTSIDGLISYSDTSNVTSTYRMFYECSSLTTIPLLDTSNVTSVSETFIRCSSLTTIPLLDTSKVTDFSNMFSWCSSLSFIPKLDTSKATSMSYMFYYCYELTNIPQLDVSNVNYLYNTFYGCSKLKSILMYGMKVDFDISSSTKFEESDLVTILNNLATVTSTKTLTMGSTNLAKLTDEEKAIATNKGWTLA